MIRTFLKLSTILVSIGIFSIGHAEKIKCPEGYICLATNDPLIMASTSPCFVNNIGVSVSYKDSVSIYLENINEDHAGIWGVFKPGVGSLEGKKEDYGFNATITLSKPKTIKSITIINNGGNEGWSTSKDQSLFGKYPYPLVVIDENSKQLNSVYDQTFSVKAGKTTFRLYGQIEVPGLDRPEISIVFTDDTKIESPIKESPPVASEMTDNIKVEIPKGTEESNNSFWNKLRYFLGF